MRPPRLRARRHAGAALLALALGVQAACFEPPIRETIEVQFLADGSAIVGSRVEFEPLSSDDNPALARRLAEARRALLEGDDAWSRRFAALAAAAERRTWEKHLGDLALVDHRALLGEPGDLGRFFADTPLAVTYTLNDGTAELTLLPGFPRPGREEKEKVEERLAAWTPEIAAYLAAGQKLWSYLDAHPERAAACLGHLFSGFLGDTDAPPLLAGEETAQTEALASALTRVLRPFEVERGQEATADELSHRVFDPFPAPLRLTLPGPALAVEGFVRGGDGRLVAQGPGFSTAFAALEGRWLSPDPAHHYLRAAASPAVEGKAAFDLEAFLALPRHAEPPPTATEIRAALSARLRPAPLYRVAFRVDPDAEAALPPPFEGVSAALGRKP